MEREDNYNKEKLIEPKSGLIYAPAYEREISNLADYVSLRNYTTDYLEKRTRKEDAENNQDF